jgi:hypothetical protein
MFLRNSSEEALSFSKGLSFLEDKHRAKAQTCLPNTGERAGRQGRKEYRLEFLLLAYLISLRFSSLFGFIERVRTSLSSRRFPSRLR